MLDPARNVYAYTIFYVKIYLEDEHEYGVAKNFNFGVTQ